MGDDKRDNEPGPEDGDRARTDPAQWVERYGDYLLRYALGRLGDRDEARDMVQETFLAAVKGHGGFAGRSAERTWLVGILKHKIIDHIRRRSRDIFVDDSERLEAAMERFFDGKGHWSVAPARWQSNPAERFEQEEFWGVFAECLRGLPERLAIAFTLREIDGMSGDEICKKLGITSTNYWVMLYRARMRLRACLEANWETEAR